MTPRFLAILNAFGCLALIGLIAIQWHRERNLESSLVHISGLRDEAVQSIHKLEEDRNRLERDIAQLKEALAETQQALDTASNDLTAKTELAGKLQTDLDTALTQVDAWQKAVAERDTRIGELNSQLSKTRARLDEAITKLNQAAAERKKQ